MQVSTHTQTHRDTHTQRDIHTDTDRHTGTHRHTRTHRAEPRTGERTGAKWREKTGEKQEDSSKECSGRAAHGESTIAESRALCSTCCILHRLFQKYAPGKKGRQRRDGKEKERERKVRR